LDTSATDSNLSCFAKLAARRHIILKKRLTSRRGTAHRTWLARHRRPEIMRDCGAAWHIGKLIRPNLVPFTMLLRS
jgi:hypothetical protein